jgi:DNA-binding NtrC family response regulator
MATKLLIVDDEVGLTKVVGLIAKQLGMEFRALNTSSTATEVFIDYQPDIVIIDMIMPDKDGIDVLNEIMSTGIPTQIVLTSGYSEGYLRLGQGVVKFHGVEQVHFLKKPFRRSGLVALLTQTAAEATREAGGSSQGARATGERVGLREPRTTPLANARTPDASHAPAHAVEW